MNERIKELIAQAREPLHNKDLPFNQGLMEYSEKFAELIVQDCCQAVERRYKYSNGTPVSFWEMSQDVQDLLKEHFGFKE